ncbi:hypothetical protein D3C72_1300900 [compost metagenome]
MLRHVVGLQRDIFDATLLAEDDRIPHRITKVDGCAALQIRQGKVGHAVATVSGSQQ